MRSVNIAKLKNQLSKYVTFAKAGEEIIIRDRSLPVAKLVPFPAKKQAMKNCSLWPPAKCACLPVRSTLTNC
jgi:prevent-host-death family protein